LSALSQALKKDAVWNCGSDKEPGHDGLTFEFFKKYWNLLENDVVSYVIEFEISTYTPQGCNSFFRVSHQITKVA
jgi:hypothetical protein